MNKVFETAYLSAITYNTRELQIDKENGIIKNISVCTVGNAKGHGLKIETGFITDLYNQGILASEGIKSRFGHPSPVSDGLGSMIGTFRDFKVSEDGTQVFADLYLSNSAKKSPNGNLFDYVLELAESHPKHFGTSIVNWNPGLYQYDGEGQKIEVSSYRDYQEGKELFMSLGNFEACDLVDSPALNPGGLFNTNSNNNLIMNIKNTIAKFFAEGTAEGEDKKTLLVGEPKKGNEVKFTSEGQDYLLPNGELLVTDGPLKGKLVILTDGKVTDIQDPEMDNEKVSEMSAKQIEAMPMIRQLNALNQKLQAELEKAPAGVATTVVSDQDSDSQSQDFQSVHLSQEINSIKKFQTKK